MRTLLLVDDDAGILEGLTDLLSGRFRVVTAADGREALAKLQGDHGIDLILLDLLMPTLDGEGVVEEMNRRGLEVPVIFASAHKDLREKAQAMKVADWIGKPFDIDRLEAKIARVLSETSGDGGASPASQGGSGAVVPGVGPPGNETSGRLRPTARA